MFSCKKNDTAVTAPKTKTELLAANTWIYTEYFRSYNTSNTILYYKRGKSNNLLNLDINKITYKTDGTYSEINEAGNTFTGTWKFLSGETQIQIVNSVGTFTSNIVLLDDKNFYWYDPISSAGTYGKMTPQ